ncbi:MAG: sigma-54-dependent Fis family transcriptional regulator [Calditrichaeota bacterium]|nr:MAG: sigma-54-dependent Fis family transcriptional regulator [Calditrichota bacterium]
MKILVVDDEIAQRNILRDILEDSGFEVETVGSGEEALELIILGSFLLVLTDLKMPGMDGIDLLQKTMKFDPDIQVILMTAFGTIPSAVNAIRSGAYDYLTKPFKKEDLLRVINRAADKVRLIEENRYLKDQTIHRFGYQNLIGASPVMLEVFRMINRIKDVDATVLITGESGTGKELVARAIHFSGVRRNGPFVVVNCGAIPETLIESELYGHEKGSFTGAARRYLGKFEQAHKGTIFLDEIGAMPLHLQTRLLRVLQDKKINRIGGQDTVDLDVRIIAATNEDLAKKIQSGEFRLDLFHRLDLFSIPIPPLRERPGDISPLARHFAAEFARRYGRKRISFSGTALRELEKYHYPGNVRELENIIEKTVLLLDTTVIEAEDLQFPEVVGPKVTESGEGTSLTGMEKQMIARALRDSRGSVKEAARALGITYKTMQYRIKKYGLNKNDFKN